MASITKPDSLSPTKLQHTGTQHLKHSTCLSTLRRPRLCAGVHQAYGTVQVSSTPGFPESSRLQTRTRLSGTVRGFVVVAAVVVVVVVDGDDDEEEEEDGGGGGGGDGVVIIFWIILIAKIHAWGIRGHVTLMHSTFRKCYKHEVKEHTG